MQNCMRALEGKMDQNDEHRYEEDNIPLLYFKIIINHN